MSFSRALWTRELGRGKVVISQWRRYPPEGTWVSHVGIWWVGQGAGHLANVCGIVAQRSVPCHTVSSPLCSWKTCLWYEPRTPQSGLHKNTKHFFKLLICTELLRNAQWTSREGLIFIFFGTLPSVVHFFRKIAPMPISTCDIWVANNTPNPSTFTVVPFVL